MTHAGEHDRIEAEIHRKELSSDPFVAAMRATRMPMIITDPHKEDNAIVFVNDAFCKLTGYTPEEILGRNCRFLQGLDTDSSKVAQIREAIIRREPIEIELLNYKKTGEKFWNRLLFWPVFDNEGDLSYFFASQLDVTPERLAEQALRELNDTLEQRVVQAVKERSKVEDQLRQSQKMEAVGQLTGGIAHDFNNLVTGITGNQELLQARVAQGQIQDVDRYVNSAQGAAKRAATLTQRLLAFSRQQTLDPKPTNVNRLIEGMEELIRHILGSATEIEVIGAAELWPTLVDPLQLENALLNLCINARDAMPAGGRLTIETINRAFDERAAQERNLQSGHYVALCVSDTGTGMTPEVMARAFDPFFTTKPTGQGTGLGLSMIYGFAQQSGGQARIYSEPEQGTMVCLYLPRHMDEVEVEKSLSVLVDAPRAQQDESILVVEDEPTLRTLVMGVMEELGYTTIEAADGASGLRVLQSTARIDLLVTDVGLPGDMNGRQMVNVARISRPDLKVLFITGCAETTAACDGHLDNTMHVMTKPFRMATLASRIREIIGSS